MCVTKLDAARLIVALLLATNAMPACAGSFISGNDLFSKCPRGSDYELECIGYIEGFVDATSALGEANIMRKICYPDRMQLGQARDVVVKYLNDHPENRHWLGATIAITALSRAFPCADNRQGHN